MLTARRDVFLCLLHLAPDSPSLHPPAASACSSVSPPPAAVPPPGADRTHGARRCAPAGAAGGSPAGPSGAEPRYGRGGSGPGAGAGQLPTLQPEPGAGVPAAGRRRPGIYVPVRVSGCGGAGSVRGARLPAEPRGAATGGLPGLVPRDPVPQHHGARRAAPHPGKPSTPRSPHVHLDHCCTCVRRHRGEVPSARSVPVSASCLSRSLISLTLTCLRLEVRLRSCYRCRLFVCCRFEVSSSPV